MFKVMFTLILGLVIVSRFSYGQNFETKIIDYNYGLKNSQILALEEDRHGFIWIGTRGGGAYRWDGNELIPFSDRLRYEVVTSIHATEEMLIFATTNDLFYFLQDSIISIHPKLFNENNTDFIYKIYEIKDEIILVSNFGKVFLFNKASMLLQDEIISFDNPENELVYPFFNNGDLIIQMNDQITQINISEQGQFIVEKQVSIGEYFNHPFTSGDIFKSKKGWLLHSEQKLYEFNESLELINVLNITFFQNINDIVYCFGTYWIATDNGVFYLSEDNNKPVQIDKAIASQFLQTQNNLFVSSLTGLIEISASNGKEINPEDLRNRYFDFEQIGNEVWAASVNSGIHIFDTKGNIKDSIIFPNDKENRIRVLLSIGKDSVLVGTEGGLFLVNNNTNKIRSPAIMKNPVLSLFKKEDNIMVGTRNDGLFIFDNKTQINYSIEDGLHSTAVYAINQIENKIYIGTSKGLKVLNEDSLYYLSETIDSKYDPITQLANWKDSLIVVGYAPGGIKLFDSKTDEIIASLTTDNGLSSDFIYFISIYNNSIVVGSTDGIEIVDYIYDKFVIHKLEEKIRFAKAETFLNGIESINGKLWLSTIAGSVIVSEETLKEVGQSSAPPIVIENLRLLDINNTDESYVNYANLLKKKITLSHNENSFIISFRSPQFGERDLRYNYQLIGYDKKPTIFAQGNSVIYRKLPPGNYKFKVSVSSENEAVLFENYDEVMINITAPFYLKSWFHILSAVVLLLFIVSLIIFINRKREALKLHDEQIKRQAQEDLRRNMAIDFHDELGNHLAKIINLSSVIRLQAVNEETNSIATKIENSAKQLFNSTKNLIQSLKSDRNNLLEVYLQIETFANNLFDQKEIELHFKNDIKGAAYIELEYSVSRDLTLILKEIFTNIYKHACASKILMTARSIEGQRFEIIIEDNGKGFDPTKNRESGGIRNMFLRAERSGLTLNIKSSASGSISHLSLKYNSYVQEKSNYN